MKQTELFKILSGERYTPYNLAKKLNAKAVLESANYEKGKERYSIILVKEAFQVCQSGNDFFMVTQGKRKKIKTNAKDILYLIEYFASQHKSIHQDIPFPAGGIGYVSYDFARYCDWIRMKPVTDSPSPYDAAFIYGHIYLIYDHFSEHLYLLGMNYKEKSIDLEEAALEIERRINDQDYNYLNKDDQVYPVADVKEIPQQDEFLKSVGIIKEEIIKGNLLQAVLSRRLEFECDISGLEAYRRLRLNNPSPYMFYLDYGEYQIFGASPETHAKAEEGIVSIKPIAGTRRRGKTIGEDALLAEDLLSDEKERAEHIMLVDLARNDIGRVCKPGTVQVESMMEVEYFSHVMHIVSTVNGEVLPGKTAGDIVRATFPAGTVSGAPKIRAIETIDSLEPVSRGFYAGLVGYFAPGGTFDTCITIRSALKKGRKMTFQAGAGIVYDSDPEREYEETQEKMRALTETVGLEV
ncbi:MAG: chorismate-binding protein [Spirochaetia bacterium]